MMMLDVLQIATSVAKKLIIDSPAPTKDNLLTDENKKIDLKYARAGDTTILYDIYKYEGLYKITIDGRIWNVKKQKWHAINLLDNGRPHCELYKHGIRKNFKVHRLVALTFIPNPMNKPQVNHIDGNKRNNHINNLEWATHRENTDHAIEHGLMGFQKVKA